MKGAGKNAVAGMVDEAGTAVHRFRGQDHHGSLRSAMPSWPRRTPSRRNLSSNADEEIPKSSARVRCPDPER